MELVPFVEEDLLKVMEISQDSWTFQTTPSPFQTTDPEVFFKRLSKNTLLAKENGEVVGVLGWEEKYPFPTGSHVCELDIAVKKNQRQKGFGSKMLRLFFVQAKEMGLKKISIRILATNEKALQMYKKVGFEVEGCLVKEFFINEQYVNDYQLAIFL